MTAVTTETQPRTVAKPTFLNSKRGRILIENLTAYLFLLPAGIIIFVFALFPVAFAFFVSLHRWRRFPEEYQGLDNYFEAIGGMAFVVFFWLAIGAALFGAYTLWRLWRDTSDERQGLAFLLPGALAAAAFLAFVNWFFALLPVVFGVPERLRGQDATGNVFVKEFFASFKFENVLNAANTMWLAVIVGAIAVTLFMQFLKTSRSGHYLFLAATAVTALAAGYLLMDLTIRELNAAIDAATADGKDLPVWSYIILISAGAGMLAVAYWLWNKTVQADEDRKFVLMALTAILLVIGAYLLITELPKALSEADKDVMNGFSVTIMYSIFSVPLQLALGLAVAVMLFENIKLKSLFRIIYFLPYITPWVATSVVFSLLFSHRPDSPGNKLINLFGISDQIWLLESKGIFQLIFPDIPGWLAGPGLALVVIIVFNIWTYAGYSAVIFLAGLGNIPRELYEAAKIDGATSWQSFRNVTLPLLSPTTFFLILITTIGTFQAFTQIFLLRRSSAYEAVDTINLYIYNEIQGSRTPDFAYGSAMAFVLFGVILILTLVQNRVAGRKVFYG
jgi:multiple sugar transport system permease protein